MRYRNVTLSGEIAAGTTTLANALAKKLGWRHVNKGEWFRRYAREHNLSLDQAEWSGILDQKIDRHWRKRLEQEKELIIEGWLAGFMARGISGVLKVLLIAPIETRVKRLMQREGLSAAQARYSINQRTKSNLDKWRQLYGQHDFFAPEFYDLVIDTAVSSRQQTLALVYAKIAGIDGGNFKAVGERA